ncbi:hypothetical protein [Streptomyces sp. NPDC059909]|uniref:hypothetical protein n=1 Tax=Streptomyces sp. NPDC059909 TaxID=3346998 RepID=UPI0036533C52
MAQLVADGDELVVRLAWWEKIVARRSSLRVPLVTVGSVAVQPDWWRALRGSRARGLSVPGGLCLGVWSHHDTQDFVAVRPRRGAVVCVALYRGAPFARISVSAPQAQRVAATIRAATHAATARGGPSAVRERPA